jgi:hypothetical protein
MFVTPFLQGVRYNPYDMRGSSVLLGRTKGGVTNIAACTLRTKRAFSEITLN